MSSILIRAVPMRPRQDGVREYIALMALELSALAKEQDAGFLAYLLNLAVAEAKAA